ncbi:uncharacterized protein LOC110038919 [Phalaenopsis equestris]|uniref:uncharacterized protein LOC110038919 n=1 Tax=Phalaenopsis equestris TaxID=78828 RepID=UPI0009E3D043|nr:uncharacterized protein LOC110038919 [Phalaenopsis equestris]
MKDLIRCFISCFLPCGALDVIRIVHSSGRVEEISGRSLVFVADIMEAHPNHVLRKLPSPSSSADVYDSSSAPCRAVTLPLNAELKRGKIYFLMPVSGEKTAARVGGQKRRRRERCLPENLKVTQRVRRKGKEAVWRPRLESISEFCADL